MARFLSFYLSFSAFYALGFTFSGIILNDSAIAQTTLNGSPQTRILETFTTPCYNGEGKHRALASCTKLSRQVEDDLINRFELGFQTAVNTGIQPDWGATDSLSPGEIQGWPVGPTCDLREDYENCTHRSLKFKRSGRRIKARFHEDSGDLQLAMTNGMKYMAHRCFIKQVVSEFEQGSFKSVSPACSGLATDIKNVTNQTLQSEKTYLNSIGKNVKGVFNQGLVANAHRSVADLCRSKSEDDLDTDSEIDQVRIASCNVAAQVAALNSAFTSLVSCEAQARAEMSINDIFHGGPNSIFQRRLTEDYQRSSLGAKVKSHGKKAKKYARRGQRSKAKKEGNRAANRLTNELGPINWNSTVALMSDLYSEPNCHLPGDDVSNGSGSRSFPLAPQNGGGGGPDAPVQGDGDATPSGPNSGGISGPVGKAPALGLFFFPALVGPLGSRRRRRKKRISKTLNVIFVGTALALLNACSGGGGSVQFPPCYPQPECSCDGSCPGSPVTGGNIPNDLENAALALRGFSDQMDASEEKEGDTLGATVEESASVALTPPPRPNTFRRPSPEEEPSEQTFPGSGGIENRLGHSTGRTSLGGLPNLSNGLKSTEDLSDKTSPTTIRTSSITEAVGYKSGSRSKQKNKNAGFKNFSRQKKTGVTLSGKENEIDFNSQRKKPRGLASIKDPADYFSKTSPLSSIFRLVEKQYRKTASDWALSRSRKAVKNP